MWKLYVRIFWWAFLANLIWENLHALLYVHYKGGAITELILMRAALFDAAVITLLLVPFFTASFFKQRLWMVVPVGIAFSIGLEFWALETGRWAYASTMPIILILGTGLTPTIQIGLLAYAVARLVLKAEDIRRMRKAQ